MKLAILNTSIITAHGSFEYQPLGLDAAKLMIEEEGQSGILSAIGHQSTAEVVSELLAADIPMNRIQFAQDVGQRAIVFKLAGRAPEGKILSREEIEEIGYDFSLLTRVS
jgi:Domain of unknown function (DUF1874)